MSTPSLPAAIISYLLRFLDQNDLLPLAEVSKNWRIETIPRMRACAVAAIHNFASFFQQRMEPSVRTEFFSQHIFEQFEIASSAFVRCNGLRDIQPIAEELRRQIETKLLNMMMPFNEVEEIDQQQDQTFNFGFEKTFFLLKTSMKVKDLHEKMRGLTPLDSYSRYYIDEYLERLQGLQQGFCQVMKDLTIHGCGTRGLQLAHDSRISNWLRCHLRIRRDLRVGGCLKAHETPADWRAEGYSAIASGFVKRGDLPGALQFTNNLPLYLDLDFAPNELNRIFSDALRDDFFDVKINELKDRILEAVAAELMNEEKYDDARGVISMICDPTKLRKFEEWFASLYEMDLVPNVIQESVERHESPI